MKIKLYLPLFFILLALTSGCALISDQPSDDEPTTAVGPSKEIGLSCFEEANLDCAQTNYCAFHTDAQAGLRCCLAEFLNFYFSEDTQALGKMLGYEPKSFSELRELSREEVVSSKALPFAEIYLLSQEDAPSATSLGAQWLKALIAEDVSVEELQSKLSGFGRGLEDSYQCLTGVMSAFEGDEMQKEIFATEEGMQVSRRDLLFIKSLLGSHAYVLQGLAEYEAGFSSFGQVKDLPGFLADFNGQAGEGDDRFGDLSQPAAERIAGRIKLLVGSFDAFKGFSQLSGQPSAIDQYLNWRISSGTQEKASEVLKAAYQSLKFGTWVPIPDEALEINLYSLSHATGVPQGNSIAADMPVLIRDENGDLDLNGSFASQFFAPVVRDQ